MASPTVSVELFPARPGREPAFWRCVGQLETLSPEFVSVTCGALASGVEERFDSAVAVSRQSALRVCAHIALSAYPGRSAVAAAEQLHADGIRRVLVVRGDAGLSTSSDSVVSCIEQIQRARPLDVSVACYPETHPEAVSEQADMDWLKAKFDAGATRAISQFVFDAEAFLRFRDRAVASGINAPLHAGVLPITHFDRIRDMADRCGTTLPPAVHAAFDGVEGNATVERLLGLDFAEEIADRLLQEGVDGLHIYCMNTPGLTHELLSRLSPAISNAATQRVAA